MLNMSAVYLSDRSVSNQEICNMYTIVSLSTYIKAVYIYRYRYIVVTKLSLKCNLHFTAQAMRQNKFAATSNIRYENH